MGTIDHRKPLSMIYGIVARLQRMRVNTVDLMNWADGRKSEKVS